MQGSRGGSSPSPGVHLAVGVGAQGRERVQGAALPHGQALLGAAVGAAAPRRGDERGERFVRRAAAQALTQIDPPRGVQTEEPSAVRRDSAAVAGAAERRRGRGDDAECGPVAQQEPLDRKSTRLNSSHLVISYAVFCLKKKKKNSTDTL